jgi:hypothetical protein
MYFKTQEFLWGSTPTVESSANTAAQQPLRQSLRSKSMAINAPEPFEIKVNDELLRLTRTKLESARFPDDLQDAGWEDGTPSSEIQKLRDFWLHSYDWREEERKINVELPQFKLNVPVTDWGHVELHFVHKRSSQVDAIPLLFTHGCMTNISMIP